MAESDDIWTIRFRWSLMSACLFGILASPYVFRWVDLAAAPWIGRWFRIASETGCPTLAGVGVHAGLYLIAHLILQWAMA